MRDIATNPGICQDPIAVVPNSPKRGKTAPPLKAKIDDADWFRPPWQAKTLPRITLDGRPPADCTENEQWFLLIRQWFFQLRLDGTWPTEADFRNYCRLPPICGLMERYGLPSAKKGRAK